MLYDLVDPEIEKVNEKNKNKKTRRKIKFKPKSIVAVKRAWEKFTKFMKKTNESKLKEEQEKMLNIEVASEEILDKSNKQIDKRAKVIARTEAKLYYLDTGKRIRNKYRNSRALQLKERMYTNLSENKDYVYKVAPNDYIKVFYDNYIDAYSNLNSKASKKEPIKEEDIRQAVDNIFNNEESDEKGGINMSNEEKIGNKGHNITGNGSRAIKNKFSDNEYSMTKDDVDNPASWVTPIEKPTTPEIDSNSMWNDSIDRDMPEIPTDRTMYNGTDNSNKYNTSEYRDAIEKLRQLRDEVSQEEQGLADDRQATNDSYTEYQRALNRIEDECRERAEKLKAVKTQRQEAQQTKKMIDQRTEEMMRQMQTSTDFSNSSSTGRRR